MGLKLALVGVVLIVLSSVVSYLAMRRASEEMGEVLATRPGSGAVPRSVSLVYLLGFGLVIVGVIAWLVG